MSIDLVARGLAHAQKTRLAKCFSPIDLWAATFRGVEDPFAAMESPPAVTLSSNNSTLIASSNYSVISVDASDPRLQYLGSGSAAFGSYRVGTGTTTTDGNSGGQMHVRFLTDAPAFEVVHSGILGARVGLIVDGCIAYRRSGMLPQTPNSGQAVYHRIDFGLAAEAQMLGFGSAPRQAAGAGYVLNEIVTVDGGTFTRPARLRVIQVAGGGVAALAVEDSGAYSALPVPVAGVYATTSSNGSGTGATVGVPLIVQAQSVRRMRRIELLLDAGVRFRGLVLRPQDTLVSWTASPTAPKVMVVGDSQNAGAYLGYPGGNMAYDWLQRLGFWEGHVQSANGGTGWITANGVAAPWSHPTRVADVIAQDPDLLVYDGGQNDAISNPAAISEAVATTLNAILAALPHVRIILIGPAFGGSTTHVAALAAALPQLRDSSRVRLIDNIGEQWLTGTGKAGAPTGVGNADFYVASDGAHLSQAGTDYRAAILASRIAAAVLDMTRD